MRFLERIERCENGGGKDRVSFGGIFEGNGTRIERRTNRSRYSNYSKKTVWRLTEIEFGARNFNERI